jgi:hypothetical protein
MVPVTKCGHDSEYHDDAAQNDCLESSARQFNNIKEVCKMMSSAHHGEHWPVTMAHIVSPRQPLNINAEAWFAPRLASIVSLSVPVRHGCKSR